MTNGLNRVITTYSHLLFRRERLSKIKRKAFIAGILIIKIINSADFKTQKLFNIKVTILIRLYERADKADADYRLNQVTILY